MEQWEWPRIDEDVVLRHDSPMPWLVMAIDPLTARWTMPSGMCGRLVASGRVLGTIAPGTRLVSYEDLAVVVRDGGGEGVVNPVVALSPGTRRPRGLDDVARLVGDRWLSRGEVTAKEEASRHVGRQVMLLLVSDVLSACPAMTGRKVDFDVPRERRGSEMVAISDGPGTSEAGVAVRALVRAIVADCPEAARTTYPATGHPRLGSSWSSLRRIEVVDRAGTSATIRMALARAARRRLCAWVRNHPREGELRDALRRADPGSGW